MAFLNSDLNGTAYCKWICLCKHRSLQSHTLPPYASNFLSIIKCYGNIVPTKIWLGDTSISMKMHLKGYSYQNIYAIWELWKLLFLQLFPYSSMERAVSACTSRKEWPLSISYRSHGKPNFKIVNDPKSGATPIKHLWQVAWFTMGIPLKTKL